MAFCSTPITPEGEVNNGIVLTFKMRTGLPIQYDENTNFDQHSTQILSTLMI